MNSKKVEILVPGDIDKKSAQDCFNLGLRMLTGIYTGGVFVAYTTEELKEQGIVSVLFRNESGAAIISMSKILTNIENNVPGEKVSEINKAGNKVLDEFVEQKNSKNGN